MAFSGAPRRTVGKLHRELSGEVVPAPKHDGLRRISVPPCPSSLLVVAFQRPAETVVNHEAHVGLVDAHTERHLSSSEESQGDRDVDISV